MRPTPEAVWWRSMDRSRANSHKERGAFDTGPRHRRVLAAGLLAPTRVVDTGGISQQGRTLGVGAATVDLSPVRAALKDSTPPEGRLDGLRWLSSRLKGEGIQVSAGSRVALYVEEFEKLVSSRLNLSTTEHGVLDRTHIATTEGGEIHDLARALLQPKPVRGWANQLRQLLPGQFAARGALPLDRLPGSRSVSMEFDAVSSDVHQLGARAVLAQFIERRLGGPDGLIEEAENTSRETTGDDRARTKQFELFVAMEARRRGFDIEFAEPDLVLRGEGCRLSVAAKRLSNIQQLEKRVREATAQIAKHGGIGVVALDLTAAFDLHRKVFVTNALAEHDELRAALDDVIRSHGSGLAALVHRQEGATAVAGITAYGRMMVFCRSERAFVALRSSHSGPVQVPAHPGFGPFRRFALGPVRSQ